MVHDNLHHRPLRSLKFLMKMLWHDVVMCMLCTKKKRKVMKTSKFCKKSKLLDNEWKKVTQVALGLKACMDFVGKYPFEF